MKITEYIVAYDENFHPELEKFKDHEWENMDDECLVDLEDAAWLFQQTFGMSRLAEEYIYILSLDGTWRVKGVYQLSHGTSQEARAGMRELFIFLLLTGAECFTIAHNHPGGGLEPSEEDRELTERIKSCAEMLELDFLEHFIITRDGYTMIIENVEMDYTKLASEVNETQSA